MHTLCHAHDKFSCVANVWSHNALNAAKPESVDWSLRRASTSAGQPMTSGVTAVAVVVPTRASRHAILSMLMKMSNFGQNLVFASAEHISADELFRQISIYRPSTLQIRSHTRLTQTEIERNQRLWRFVWNPAASLATQGVVSPRLKLHKGDLF